MPGQARILVVQSDQERTRFLTELLTDYGYDVHSPVPGESIFESVLSFLPQFVLLDTVLDGTDGYLVCQALNAGERTASIPVILTLHQDECVGCARALAAGAADYIRLPLVPEEARVRVKMQSDLLALKEQLAVQSEQLQSSNAAQQQSEEKYRALVENINDVLFTVDARGVFTYISPAIERFAHYSVQEVLGRSFARFVHPDDLPGVIASFGRTLDGQLEPAEFRVLDADGTVVYVRTSSRPIVREGHPIGLSGIMNNVTDLVNVHVELERRVAERTAELGEANKLLKAQVQERQQEIAVREKAAAELEQANRMLKILSECNQMLMYATEEKDLLARLCRLIVDHGGYPLTWVGLVEQDETPGITPAAQLGFPAGYLEQTAATWEENAGIGALAWRAIHSGEISIARDIPDNPEWMTSREEAARFGYASSVALPLHELDKVFGVVVIYAQEPDGFQPEELALLSELVGDLAYGILALRVRAEQKRSEAELQRAHVELETRVEQRTAELKQANQQLAMLYQVGQTIVSPLQLERVLDVIARGTAGLLGSDTGVILLLDEAEQALTIRGAFGLSEEVIRGTRDRIGESIAGRVVQSGEPILANDLPNDPRFYNPAAAREGLLACASVPLVVGGRIIGTLDVHSKTDRFAFREGQIQLLQMIANQAAIALENARLYDRLQQAHDQLEARVHDRTAELSAANAQLQLEIAERKRAELETGQRLAELEAINRISTAMRSAQTLDQMLPSLLDETLRVLSSDAGLLWLSSAGGGAALEPMTRGWPAAIAQAPTALEGVAATVLSTGKPFVSREFFNDLVIRPYTRTLVPPGWGGACIPIRTSQEIVGILLFSVQLPRELTQSEEHLLTTIAEIAGNAIQRTALHEQTERQLKHLTALQAIDSTITSSFDLRMTLEVVLAQITRQLGVDAADILLLKPLVQTLEFGAGRGFRSPAIEHLRVRLDQGLIGRAVLERRTVGVPDLASGSFDHPGFLAHEDFHAYYGVPLITKGKVVGVLEIFNRTPIKPSDEWLGFMETFARQAAIAVDNYTLFDNVQRSKDELALAYEETIEGWSRALDLRDKETEGHTQRVTEMAARLATAMGINDAELSHIRRGALLHDIGKMGIPDSILLKRAPLSDEDWVLMRRHPVYAYELLMPIRYLHPAIDIPYCHHERWDGQGYPRGLSGEEIPLAARVFSVVDVYDALSNDRFYRAAWPEWQVRQYLQDEAGKRFDPTVVDMFLQMQV